MKSIDKLAEIVSHQDVDVSYMLDDDERASLAKKVIRGYEIDYDSTEEWRNTNREAYDLMDNIDELSKDETKRAKIIYPLTLYAVVSLQSRLTPHAVRNGKAVDIKVEGPDPDGSKNMKATAVSSHMNWQLISKSTDWLSDTYKLFSILCSSGTAFRKVYYDPKIRKTCFKACSYDEIVINNHTKSLVDARRISTTKDLYYNQIVSEVNAGYYRKKDLDLEKILKCNAPETQYQGNEDMMDTVDYYDAFHHIIEQMTYYDLDKDGFEEPYLIEVHKATEQILRMTPWYRVSDIRFNDDQTKVTHIAPKTYIVDFHCISNPRGCFYSKGLNHVLLHNNKAINSLFRQLVDSGALANVQGGFYSGMLKTKEKELEFENGVFKKIETPPNVAVQDTIMPLPFKEPSAVLFQLLGLLIETSKEVSYISDTLTGDIQGQNVPATTMLAMVEQGTRAFKPLIQQIYMGFQKEFKVLFENNSVYQNYEDFCKYQQIPPEFMGEAYNLEDMDIVPVADPTMSSEAHKFAKAQSLLQAIQIGTPVGAIPNPPGAMAQYFAELGFEGAETFMQPPPQQGPGPEEMLAQAKTQESMAKAQSMMMKAQTDQVEANLKAEELKLMKLDLEYEGQKVRAKVAESKSKVLKNQADAIKGQQDVEFRDRELDIQEERNDISREDQKLEEKRIQVMARKSSNGSSRARP